MPPRGWAWDGHFDGLCDVRLNKAVTHTSRALGFKFGCACRLSRERCVRAVADAGSGLAFTTRKPHTGGARTNPLPSRVLVRTVNLSACPWYSPTVRRLTDRLRVLYDAVIEHAPMADIATDHAWLPIALIKDGRVPRAIATDIAAAPVAAACARVESLGLQSQIEVRRGDGLSPISAGEAETVVIAGVGGQLIARMLSAGLVSGVRRWVLQPNLDHEQVRRTLYRVGLVITDEQLVRCSGRWFTTIIAEPKVTKRPSGAVEIEAEAPASWNEDDWRWGAALLARRDPQLVALLTEAYERADRICRQVYEGGGDEAAQRQADAERFAIRRALARCGATPS